MQSVTYFRISVNSFAVTSLGRGRSLPYTFLIRAGHFAKGHKRIGCLSAARKAGLTVPGDLSVIGFDGIDFSAHTEPPLTTVAVPEKEMSRMAIHLLKQLINKEITPPKSYCLETDLIVRKSCAPPPAE